MLISVVVVTFNQQSYIEQCLLSILSQITTHDVELIIVDDGSSDRTLDICSRLTKDSSATVQLISHDVNMGLPAAYSTAFSKCNGDYIAICEGDDWWVSRDKLEKQANFLMERLDCQSVHTCTILGSESPSISSNQFVTDNSTALQDQITKSCIPHTSSLMFRNNWVAEYRIVFDGRVNLLDGVFSTINSLYGGTGFLHDVFTYYRVHQSSLWTPLRASEAGQWALISHQYSSYLLSTVVKRDEQAALLAKFRVIGYTKNLLKHTLRMREYRISYWLAWMLHADIVSGKQYIPNRTAYLVFVKFLMVVLCGYQNSGQPQCVLYRSGERS